MTFKSRLTTFIEVLNANKVQAYGLKYKLKVSAMKDDSNIPL